SRRAVLSGTLTAAPVFVSGASAHAQRPGLDPRADAFVDRDVESDTGARTNRAADLAGRHGGGRRGAGQLWSPSLDGLLPLLAPGPRSPDLLREFRTLEAEVHFAATDAEEVALQLQRGPGRWLFMQWYPTSLDT